ncbi:Uncharacterized protein T10_2689 [Trichinella papuae]|uniref:Apple domain-containing protein n=1 Tax=Trichinella papuae TaxID=268474 RepID=A0A0V1MZ29_9BILA|nr:Uncharacterized protein T10_2689 [Trichinella papuae]
MRPGMAPVFKAADWLGTSFGHHLNANSLTNSQQQQQQQQSYSNGGYHFQSTPVANSHSSYRTPIWNVNSPSYSQIGYSKYVEVPFGSAMYNRHGFGPTVGQPPPSPMTCPIMREDACFGKASNCAIKNAMPFERRAMITSDQCKNCCLQYSSPRFTCQSFVYDREHQLCDMFGHLGDQHPAVLLPTPNRDYYELTSSTCRNVEIHQGIPSVQMPYSTLIPTFPQTRPPSISPLEIDTWGGCKPGEVVKYYKIIGKQLISSSGSQFSPMTDQQCIQICTANRAKDGREVICQSFDFISSANRCIFYGPSESKGRLEDHASVQHFEKVCFPENLVKTCSDVFVRMPKKVLIGYARTVTDADSIKDCIIRCLNSDSQYGFQCQSGVFFNEEDSLNCVLNSQTKDTAPSLLIDETAYNAEYFQLYCHVKEDGLIPSADSKDVQTYTAGVQRGEDTVEMKPSLQKAVIIAKEIANDWTLWSPCEPNGMRRRYKVCDEADIRNCPLETQQCTAELKSLKRSSKGLDMKNCMAPHCCPMFGSCTIGVQQMPDGRMKWCNNPC